jgi:predicted alpha/beta-hydrolase family hydrolase
MTSPAEGVGGATPGRAATEVVEVETPLGPGRFFLDVAATPAALLVLGHGAGGGVTAADLELLARRLPPLGVTVARFEQPWRTAGGRVAVAPPRLDIGWRAGIERLLDPDSSPLGPLAATPPLFFGGRSAGARVACRTAPDFPVAGVVCLAFPLHLPGRPEKSRLPELLTPSVPRLVLQGSNDSFGGAAELRAALAVAAPQTTATVSVVELPGADHSFRLAKGSPFTPADLRESVLAEVAAFLLVPPASGE